MIPRSEYPRPQFVRENWMNLNGAWEFAFDFGDSGIERKMFEDGDFPLTITVPFCPESELSGIGYKDFMNAVWYRRTVSFAKNSGRVLLHFGAVDYETHVWVNGKKVGEHRGGYSSFTFDVTAAAQDGENTIVVCARDHLRSGLQPAGKQSTQFYSHECDYTRTTGIWQTVWLEFVPQTYLRHCHVVSDDLTPQAVVTAAVEGSPTGKTLRLSASYQGRPMGSTQVPVTGASTTVALRIAELHLWEAGNGRLYDLTLELLEGETVLDRVESYFGMRSITIDGDRLLLNHRPVFQRLVLDQGFYPDGIYTAPTDEALRRDIELSMNAGFNGARLHQKVFEERYLFWADQMGYLVWGEHASWKLDMEKFSALDAFLPEWMEVLERDRSHPAIIGWCPFNETWNHIEFADGRCQKDSILAITYQLTKAIDPTRPVIDTSGYIHVVTDVYDLHDYEGDVEVYRARYQDSAPEEHFNWYPMMEHRPGLQPYGGQPYFISEYGGIWWNPAKAESSWGYGKTAETEEEVVERYCGLTTALLCSKKVCAFCYTQFTDVEQECNGLYYYDRSMKFTPEAFERIRQANLQTAAIEEQDS
ncbi:MAG: glycoside hydrolase family 2 protein [Acutalibacteraceae bacterium]|jgi:beta-galactosidase/beta-glucuronidase